MHKIIWMIFHPVTQFTAVTDECRRSFGGLYFILCHSSLRLLDNAEDHLGGDLSFCAMVYIYRKQENPEP